MSVYLTGFVAFPTRQERIDRAENHLHFVRRLRDALWRLFEPGSFGDPAAVES